MNSNIFLLTLIFFSTLFSVLGQSPEKFKYQAIIRNTDGSLVTDQNVSLRISIISDSPTGSVAYSEEHTAMTNQFGLVMIEIGGGVPVLGSMNGINWGNTEHFLSIEFDVSGGMNYINMGTSQLLSVPYALYAKTAGTTENGYWTQNGTTLFYNAGNVGIGSAIPEGKLAVCADSTAGIDDVIFSVVNATGDTVFAVYQEGVRIYVSENSPLKATGSKGGFAVGGFSHAKNIPQEYLVVTPDSVRVYIDKNYTTSGTSGSKGGFAVGGFSQAKTNLNENYLFVQDDSTRIYTGDTTSGFGIENLSGSNGASTSYMHLTPNNYMIGHQAGNSISDGLYNSFIGYESGFSNTFGSKNYFIGYRSGYENSTGNNNIFLGDSTGFYNINGYRNVFIGNQSGLNNISGSYNVFIGENTGRANTSGYSNVFVGATTGFSNTTGIRNVFVGNWAGNFNTTGSNNVFLGNRSGWNNTSGSTNIMIGNFCGFNNVTGSDNLFIGNNAGYSSDTCYSNIFIGNNSGESNIAGLGNVFLGNRTGADNTTGAGNTIIGHESGHFTSTGDNNTFLGAYSGFNNSSGYNNVLIGFNTGANNNVGFNNTIIGNYAADANSLGGWNVIIGSFAGRNSSGSGNIFIGTEAGAWESGSHKLYIDNSDTDFPLIYGDFVQNKVTVNDLLNIAPRFTAPSSAVEGDIYYDANDHKLKVFDGTIWQNCF